MGTKKQGMTVLKGSLKSHWMMYVNYVNLQINPADRLGMGMGNHMIKMMSTLSSKYVQPGFEFKHAIVQPKTYYAPSIMHLKFCNGYERKYNISMSPLTHIKHEIQEINQYIEFERVLTGQDDELEEAPR